MSFMYSDDYSYDLYRGNINVGDVIKAEMNSWKQGNKVIKRELSHLKK